MKKLNLICLLIILCFSITSCNHDIDENERVDKNEVSSITATALENSIMLSWTNPDDENFASTEIQFTPTVSTISQPIILAGRSGSKFTQNFINLESGQTYTFTLTAKDKDNKPYLVKTVSATTTTNFTTKALE